MIEVQGRFTFTRASAYFRPICHSLAAIVCALSLLIAAGGAAFAASSLPSYAPVWEPLAKRLSADGLAGPEVDALLAQLGSRPTQSPMGRKIRELYIRHFFPQTLPKTTRQTYYKGVVTEANAQLCREYIHKYQAFFNLAQQRYGVPPAIACALLFVETRLGKVLGDVPENAFVTLASMAISRSPASISEWLPRLPGYQERLNWLDENLRKRSDWAYVETRALIRHMLKDRVPPSRLPGSIYGAVGLCQFMPSNISTYGADGDGDGRVDLFNEADAIASLARYLAMHGWKKGIGPEREHQLLMTYNHSTVYANTIMALAALIEKRDYTPPGPKARKKSRR